MGWEFHNRARSRTGKYVDLTRKYRINIRCREDQKDAIRNTAYAMGMDVTEYVLMCCMHGVAQHAKAVKGGNAACETLDGYVAV